MMIMKEQGDMKWILRRCSNSKCCTVGKQVESGYQVGSVWLTQSLEELMELSQSRLKDVKI